MKNTLKYVLKAIVLIAAIASSPTLALSQQGSLQDLISRPSGDIVVGMPLSVKSVLATIEAFREQQLSRHCIDAFLSTANDAMVFPATTSFGVNKDGKKTINFSGPLVPQVPLVILRIVSTCPYQTGEVNYKLATRVAELTALGSSAKASAGNAKSSGPKRFDFSKSDQLKESYIRPKQVAVRPTPEVHVNNFDAALPENALNQTETNKDSGVESSPESISMEESSTLLKAEMPLQTEVFLPVGVPSLSSAQSGTGNAVLPSHLTVSGEESRLVYFAVIALALAICLVALFMHWRGGSAVGGLLRRRSSLSEPKINVGVEAERFGDSVLFGGKTDKSISSRVFCEDLEYEEIDNTAPDSGPRVDDPNNAETREKVSQDYFMHDLLKIVQGAPLKPWHIPADVLVSLNLSETLNHSIESVPSWLRSYVALVECCFRRAQEGVLIRAIDVELIVSAINEADMAKANVISSQSLPIVVDLLDAKLLELPSINSKKAFVENLNALPKLTHGKAISFDEGSWADVLKGLGF